MGQTSVGGFVYIDPQQGGQAVTANEAFEEMAKTVLGEYIKDLTSESTSFTLPYSLLDDLNKAAVHNYRYLFNGTPAGALDIIVPDENNVMYVENACGQDLTVKTSGGTGITVRDGQKAALYCDGTNVLELFDLVDRAYDVGGFLAGVPGASEIAYLMVAVRKYLLPVDLTGSQGYALTAATAQTDFDIRRNGASIGTMRFAISGTVATFIFATETEFVAGDRLRVVAPASPDATLSNIAFTFAGIRV